MSASPGALRQLLRELAEADAERLLSEARRRALARAAKVIEDELVGELLAAAARSGAAWSHPERADVEPPEQAWWTYCVLWARDAASVPPGLEGIEPDTSVEVVRQDELAVLVSSVPAPDYDDARLREHLEDLAWVERTARRHEAVLEQTLAHLAIVPLRLCTLYRGTDGVRRLLRDHAAALRDGLRKVDGCAEWGVKVFAGPARAPLGDDTDEREPAGERAGAAYLLQRRQERERVELAAEVRARCAEAVHERISVCARESIANPPQRPELHGRDMAMVLNGAHLVERDRASELHDAVLSLRSEWEPRGFVIELTGPWPAYNFVSAAAGVMR